MGRKKKPSQKMDTNPFEVKKNPTKKKKKKRKRKKKKVSEGRGDASVEDVLLAVTRANTRGKNKGVGREGKGGGEGGGEEDLAKIKRLQRITEEAVNEAISQLATVHL